MKKWDETCHDLSLFMGMIYNACHLPIWCFGISGKFYYTSCPYEKEFRMFLENSGCLEYALDPSRDRSTPIYLSDPIGLIWVCDYAWKGNSPNILVLMGPIFNGESSLKGIEDSMRSMNFSVQMQQNLIQKLKKVPVMSMSVFEQYTSMLHYIITSEPEVHVKRNYQHPINKTDSKEKPQIDPPDISVKSKVSIWHERSNLLEECIMNAIKEGNIHFSLNQVIGEQEWLPPASVSINHYHTKEVNRDEKNTVVIFSALCTRAAMEGGLAVKTAQAMENEYISRAEQAQTVTELMVINREMIHAFIEKVHQTKSVPQISQPIRECCDYIQRNLLSTLELEEIAKYTGYTEYYLTRKFKKEMGIHLTDYIKESKIELAKVWLLTTNKSIQEISDEMHFSTRNYFSKVFREKVGISPGMYRDNAGKMEYSPNDD